MSDPSISLEPVEPESKPVEPRRRRRFTLLDIILLVAVVAVGQRGYQAVLAIYAGTGVGSPSNVIASIKKSGLLSLPYHVLFWFEVAAPLLLSLVLTLVVARRMPPRPPREQIGRQPGSVAMSSALFGALAVFAVWGLVGYPLLLAGKFIASGVSLSTQYPILLRVMLVSMVSSGASVASGWGNLIFNGSSLDDADWVEWAGRILGTLVLLSTPIYLWAALIIY